MRFVCLGYIDEEVWASMSEADANDFIDRCFTYDDELRRHGHMVGGTAFGSYRQEEGWEGI